MKPSQAISAVLLLAVACSDPAGANRSPAFLAFAKTDYAVALNGTATAELFTYDAQHDPIADSTPAVWTSSDDAIVFVDGAGNLVGRALGGPVTITATKGTATATTNVRVTAATISVTSIPSLDPGNDLQLSATAFDATGAIIPGVTTAWSVIPSTVATVSPDGRLHAFAPGPFTLVATSAGKEHRVEAGVTSAYDGSWEGKTADSPNAPGQLFRMNVRYGTVTLVQILDVPVFGCSGFQTAYNQAVSAPIVNGAFSYTIPVTDIVNPVASSASGTFASETQVSGQHNFISLGRQNCPGGGGSIPVTIPPNTFSATRR